MRKVMKWLGIIIGVIILLLAIGFWVINDPKPKGVAGSEAEALAEKMALAINQAAWDTTGAVQWTFRNTNSYLWDRARDLVEVKWENYRVLLNTKTQTGKAWENTTELVAEAKAEALQKAFALFCNDSFWLNAPAKAFDGGTTRSIVTDKEGKKALMVHYSSGGVTPGDAYLWYLDESGLPQSYKMWVSIIPVGGMQFSWEQWTTLETGARIATMHHHKYLDIPITDLKGTANLEDFGFSEDPFLAIIN